MTFYARLQATATRLIADKGKAAYLIRTSTSGPPHNPVVIELPPIEIKMVETGYSLTNRNETLVQAGDKLGIISSDGETPLMSDKIEIDGAVHSFVDIKPLNPGGLTLLYEFHARR